MSFLGEQMSYVESSLTGDEKILYQAKISWWKIFWPVFWTLATFFCLSIFTIPWLIISCLHVTSTEFAVTDRKILAKWGIFSRFTIDQRLSKIDSVSVTQGIGGRLFGYGSVSIRGSGMSFTPLNYVFDPMSLKRSIEQATEALPSQG